MGLIPEQNLGSELLLARSYAILLDVIMICFN